ncbi:TspO/MBR family protein [Maricaulis sp.]|jgi:tryptophan-rich sensory protein|uniref:TspO/MBR family protein n=1 Tax=Maricaulis sp. TaxID=1486257 RepID=UPI00261E5F30|nr:TspO/MBR family protein [Maricaulis sp.]
MGEKHQGPGVVTLLVYLIGVASLAGGLSGWVHASGSYAWLEGLNAPNWTPSFALLNLVGLFIPVFAIISVWIVQRSGRDGTRLLASLLTGLLLAGMTTQIVVFFATRDVTLGFLIAIAMWLYALFAANLAGRSSKPAGVLLWVPFGWHTFLLVLGFELMRLNNGTTFAGGL